MKDIKKYRIALLRELFLYNKTLKQVAYEQNKCVATIRYHIRHSINILREHFKICGYNGTITALKKNHKDEIITFLKLNLKAY